MPSRLQSAIARLPKPFIPLLPIVLSFAGPGLLIWLLAFHVRVPYPQETMAPYVDSTPATMDLARHQAPARSIPPAAAAGLERSPPAPRRSNAARRS
jgi:hypothetical protein